MARTKMLPVNGWGLTSTPSTEAPEDASETFLEGAVLVSNGGYLEEAGTNPAQIVGISAGPGHNAAADGDSNIRFHPAMPHVVFEGSIDNNGDLGNGAIAATDRFEAYGITEDANGVWYVDKGKTGGDARVVIVGFRDAVGVVNGRVYFTFLADNTIYGVN